MFFDSGSFGRPTVTMPLIKGWASAVCDQHLGAGADPTECLTKVAAAEGLTPPQVEVLAGEINRAIHHKKFASAEEKYHAADFPLANAKIALERLQAPAQVEKVAVEMPDPVGSDFDFFGAFGVMPEKHEKTAGEKTAEVRGKLQKAAALKRMQDDACEMAKVAMDDSELAYIHEVRQHVLGGMNGQERLLKIGEALHAARCAGLVESAKLPLAKVAKAFVEEGLIPADKAGATIDYLLKHADEKAPDYLISEWLKAKVVNGKHPLIVKLQTFCDNAKEVSDALARRNVCDDQVRIYSQKMREL